MGARNKGRIADDRNPTERHAWRLQVVNWLQYRFLDQPHDLPELRRHKPFRIGAHLGNRLGADQRWWNRNRVCHTALVSEQPLQFRCFVGRPVPNHIVTAVRRAKIRFRPPPPVTRKIPPPPPPPTPKTQKFPRAP